MEHPPGRRGAVVEDDATQRECVRGLLEPPQWPVTEERMDVSHLIV